MRLHRWVYAYHKRVHYCADPPLGEVDTGEWCWPGCGIEISDYELCRLGLPIGNKTELHIALEILARTRCRRKKMGISWPEVQPEVTKLGDAGIREVLKRQSAEPNDRIWYEDVYRPNQRVIDGLLDEQDKRTKRVLLSWISGALEHIHRQLYLENRGGS